MSRNPDHPYDGLYRMTPAHFSIRNDNDDDGRTMFGHFALFDVWTEINGWEGNFLERIAPGAAAKTIQERGDRYKVLFNHGFDPQIGDKPLGKSAMIREDDTGVYHEVPFARTSYADDILELIRSGAIDGQSFMFSVTRDEWDDEPDPSDHNPKGLPERTIREFKLFEAGPVTFPAYEATTTGIRSRDAYALWLQTRHRDQSDAADPGTLEESHGNAALVGTLSETRAARIAARIQRINEVLTDGPHPKVARGDR